MGHNNVLHIRAIFKMNSWSEEGEESLCAGWPAPANYRLAIAEVREILPGR